MSLIEDLFNLIAPHNCVGCNREGSLLCEQCAALLQKVPARCYKCQRWSAAARTCQACRRQTPLYGALAITPYTGVAKQVIHRLKFERAQAAADDIARVLAEGLSVADVLITHVPTAERRVRERGYDQAALIAKALARRLNQPYLPLLARIGDQRQVGQQRDVRAQQLRQAFRPIHATSLTNKHILLIDDVLTTGATCEAAARALRSSGARRVSAAVFAVA